ncbi:MAG TPA: DUF4374 domain-containing protein [Polyangiaceae bacterium]|nr:DUF4374 domain-containing protein [Polyangiaceae bacterium]
MLVLACGSDGTTGDVDSDAAGAGAGARATNPAVMVGVVSDNPDGRQSYVGVFPSIPSGDVTAAGMREYGDAYFYVYDGSVFVFEREQGEIIRLEANEALELVEGPRISFANYGVQFSADNTFISPTRAYMVDGGSGQIIVWNPSEMTITGSFPANIPQREGLETFPGPGIFHGDSVVWPLMSSFYDTVSFYPKAAALVASATTDEAPVVVEDDRCLPGYIAYSNSEGDIYFHGNADGGWRHYTMQADIPPACVLRMNAGETSFDPDYQLDIGAATGAPIIYGSWRVSDRYWIERVWDPAVPLPVAYGDYLAGTDFVSMLLDLETGTTSPFPAVPRGGVASGFEDRVDGSTYVPLPTPDGSGEIVYRVLPDGSGVAETFTVRGGGYWGMGKLR